MPCHPKRYDGNLEMYTTRKHALNSKQAKKDAMIVGETSKHFSVQGTSRVLLCTSQILPLAGAQLLFSFSRAGARPSDLHAAAKRGDLRQLQQRLAEGWAKDWMSHHPDHFSKTRRRQDKLQVGRVG